MNKKDYIESGVIKNFIEWISLILDQPNSFIHAYTMKKPASNWRCTSLYTAYENYCWPFACIDPGSGERISGNSFQDSTRALTMLSKGLRMSIANVDHDLCRQYCISILKWGGVSNGNEKRIETLDLNLCDYLEMCKKKFTAVLPLDKYYSEDIIITSGFSKIYSLYIDNYVIYDGRVGAALGLLIRKYCEDKSLVMVPHELSFAWCRGREATYKIAEKNRRNPGNGPYRFNEIANNPRRHMENNIRANWLLEEILNKTESKFNQIEANIQFRALEAALFIIGYDVRS